ncbi:MAG: acyl-CoA dehydrogenase short-chain specific [Pseudomonadota bacterium]|nr:acyl-CoA dehydrogenase family protein [Pseudomonadota bacterium]MEC7969226.1 acyl-CoA dehydrogenase family protein [Pseudomonadota bacterium]MEC7991918.1 acyl-CoA dehydrogenase family protein [Pseudomonadota bacterium]MEC8500191.1 acyl-CoA dehydrogenase family protein [Pseudomonadota bacterium]MEC9134487.1 acyl-CoA dehydrogenase family protein [Pseudomonadota bacterium]
MNFDLSEEQQLLSDSVARFVNDQYPLDQRQLTVLSEQGFSSEHWQTMAELGWLGASIPEQYQGFGGNQADTMVLMEQLGKGLVLEPFFASAVLAASALKYGGSDTQQNEWLPQIADGSKQLTLAYAEEQARFDLHDVITRAEQNPDGFTLNGRKSMVLHAASADAMIVSARVTGAQTEKSGIELFLVDTNAEGVTINAFPTVDGLRAAEVKLNDVSIPAAAKLACSEGGFKVLNRVAIDGILALAAEAVGAMEVLYKDTVAYTQEREQFDHPLSNFQVLQHRMVDMFMEYEQCKSLLYRATLEVVQRGDEAQRTVHALKYLIGKNGIFIGENAVQLHGGMGMTEELRIAHYFKRLLVIDAQFGNHDYHLAQFAG